MGSSAGGVAFAPIISASDAWVIFRQAHFYKGQRRTPPAHLRTEGVDCQQAIPRLEAGAVPIQGPGLPQSSSGQGSAPLECGGLPLLLLREPGAVPSPPHTSGLLRRSAHSCPGLTPSHGHLHKFPVHLLLWSRVRGLMHGRFQERNPSGRSPLGAWGGAGQGLGPAPVCTACAG